MTTHSQKYELKSFLIHVACPSFLPCVKDMDKFHEPKLVALAPPTYVLRVWIEAYTYAWNGVVGE